MRCVSLSWLVGFLVSVPLYGASEVISHGPRVAEKKVALTFDACPTRGEGFDQRILETLWSYQVPTTFFLSGAWIEKHEDLTRYLANMPFFELGSHAYAHPMLTQLTTQSVKEDLAAAQYTFFGLLGVWPQFLRPPYGEYNDQVLTVASELGLKTINFDVPSGDADMNLTPKALVDWVNYKTHSGSIIVMHINHPEFHTAEILPQIIEGLRAQGFELTTVSSLLASQTDENVCVDVEPEMLVSLTPPAFSN